MNRLALILLAVVAACGPSTPQGTMPMLPGDGDDNVAKPKTGDAAAKAPDPWEGRTDLIETPAAQPPVEVALPPIQRFTLKNGLQVIQRLHENGLNRPTTANGPRHRSDGFDLYDPTIATSHRRMGIFLSPQCRLGL